MAFLTKAFATLCVVATIASCVTAQPINAAVSSSRVVSDSTGSDGVRLSGQSNAFCTGKKSFDKRCKASSSNSGSAKSKYSSATTSGSADAGINFFTQTSTSGDVNLFGRGAVSQRSEAGSVTPVGISESLTQLEGLNGLNGFDKPTFRGSTLTRTAALSRDDYDGASQGTFAEARGSGNVQDFSGEGSQARGSTFSRSDIATQDGNSVLFPFSGVPVQTEDGVFDVYTNNGVADVSSTANSALFNQFDWDNFLNTNFGAILG